MSSPIQNPTYVLVPNCGFRPGGPISLGNIITNPFKPNIVLSKPDPTRPSPETVTPQQGDRSVNLWLSFLKTVEIEAETKNEEKLRTNHAIPTFETVYFKDGDINDLIVEGMKDQKVATLMKPGYFLSRPVYMVVGLKIATGMHLASHEVVENQGHSGMTRAANKPIKAVGAEAFSIGQDAEMHISSSDQIVFAYQLLKIAPKCWEANEALQLVEYQSLPPALGSGGDDGDNPVQWKARSFATIDIDDVHYKLPSINVKNARDEGGEYTIISARGCWYWNKQQVFLYCPIFSVLIPYPSALLVLSIALVMASTLSHSNLLALVAGVVTIAYFVTRKMFGHGRREPPLAPQSVPLVGHMIGMSRSKFNYYVDLSKQVAAPIFTMALPGQKMYVVTNPELIQMVQKQHKTLAFPPIEAKFASTVCGASHEAQSILAKNVNGDDGDFGLSMESYEAMRSALKPGSDLDDMNRSMIREVVKLFGQLQPDKGKSKTLGMHGWLRDAITTATTRSVYGPLNPYDDPEIVDAFWEFEGGLMSILIGFLPALTARKAIAARTKVAKAFEKYYKAGGVQQASALTRKRYQAEIDNNVPLDDIARYEVGGSIAVLVNTAPAAFWTLLLLHSYPGLLGEVRKEVDACIKTTTENRSTVRTLDITTLKESCPLLVSSYQEVLRYRSMGTSVREVMEDTYLDQWLLKKGAMLQMPSHEYNPRRFMPEHKKNRPRDVCFRAFGGGKTLCPGRHFATNEILAVVATFIARFEMTPTSSEWKLPTTMNTNVAAVVMQPDHDIDVEIKNREGFADNKWVVNLRPSRNIFALVTEDHAETV
ncbi:hypothetical protein O1611_g1878 [Lasiodiplodia mahajangana]|uniref:Uncharacterized protein n=1 Tax=Lasiodiplodia mahajangana TaxID=1108764 RepID=A0ACC2JW56_9PEZI|nr:hypothetical protein O1611_g1878 [Lasiodiplodia mahajangana]